MTMQLLIADLTRYLVGRSWRALMAAGMAFGCLTTYGYTAQLNVATIDVASETALTASMWFTLYLFAALLSGSLFALDDSSGTLARLFWASRTRSRLFQVRTASAATAGVIFGLVAAIAAVVSTAFFLPQAGVTPVYTFEFGLTVLGVFLSSVSASMAGLFIGMLLRSNAATMATIALMTLLVEPAIQRLQPESAKFLYTIALSAVYRDDNDHLLSMAGGLVVTTAWLLVIGGLAYRSLLNREIGS